MPNNKTVFDPKPKNEIVLDHKPNNEIVFDWKPKNEKIAKNTTSQLFDSTLSAGFLVGFGPAITYPADISVTGPKTS